MLLILLGLTGLVIIALLAQRREAAIEDEAQGVGTYTIEKLPDYYYRERKFFEDSRVWR
jgi:hypothetical protein